MPGLLRSHLKGRNTVLIGLAPTGGMAVLCGRDTSSYPGHRSRQPGAASLPASSLPCVLARLVITFARHLTRGQKSMGLELEGHGR